MWPRKLKTDTSAPNRNNFRSAVLLLLGLLGVSCSPGPSGASGNGNSDAITLRVAPLYDYAWLDRSGSGQPDRFKPESERLALYSGLSARPADVLMLRGLGHAATLDHLNQSLSNKGLQYTSILYLPGPDRYHGIGILSRRPFEETLDLSPQTFRIRDEIHRPHAGAVRFGRTWIWNANAPSPTREYEQRRNEARLLSQTLRDQINEGYDVLLSLHSREEPDTPMLRMIEEAGLVELPAADDRSDRWTHRDPDRIAYRRDQWLFASPALAEQLGTVRILDTPDLRTAGPFRHQEILLSLSEALRADGHTPSPANPVPAQTLPGPRSMDQEPR
jgi:hypothetical protein